MLVADREAATVRVTEEERIADEEAAATATDEAEPAGVADEEVAEAARVAGKEAEAAAKM